MYVDVRNRTAKEIEGMIHSEDWFLERHGEKCILAR